MPNDREFLGRGWRFPVAINLTGGISNSALEENVRESIFVILGTATGEAVLAVLDGDLRARRELQIGGLAVRGSTGPRSR